MGHTDYISTLSLYFELRMFYPSFALETKDMPSNVKNRLNFYDDLLSETLGDSLSRFPSGIVSEKATINLPCNN